MMYSRWQITAGIYSEELSTLGTKVSRGMLGNRRGLYNEKKINKIYFSLVNSESKEENAIFLLSCPVSRLSQDLIVLDSVLIFFIILSHLILSKTQLRWILL